MTVRADERGQILILLGMWLFFGGGAAGALVVYEHAVSDMKHGVEEVISEAGRKKAILSDISQWEHVYEGQNEEVSESRKELLEALRHKNTQRSQLDPILAKLDQGFLVMDWDFLNLRFRVTKQVTGAEWAQIVARSRSQHAQAAQRLTATDPAAVAAGCVRVTGCGQGAGS